MSLLIIMEKGKFISFEGIDNSGKSTQIDKLKKYLEENNIPFIVSIDPGTTTLGVSLRKILKYPTEVHKLINERFNTNVDVNQSRSPEAESLLFMAARAEYVQHIITPNLNKGINVISDRFLDSTRAYQGGGRFGSDQKIIDLIELSHKIITSSCGLPIKTFFLDVPYEIMIKRSSKKRDFMESLSKEFYLNTIKEYKKIALDNPVRIIKIDGTKDADSIFIEYIIPEIKKIFNI